MAPARLASWRNTISSSSANGRACRFSTLPSRCARARSSCVNVSCSLSACARPAARPAARPCSQASRSSRPRSALRRWPTTGPSTCGTVHASMLAAADSDIFLSALAAQLHLALIGHAARGHDDFLLRGLHFAELDRALGLEVVLQHLRGALGHVLEELVL